MVVNDRWSLNAGDHLSRFDCTDNKQIRDHQNVLIAILLPEKNTSTHRNNLIF